MNFGTVSLASPQVSLIQFPDGSARPGRRELDAAHFVISPILEIANCQEL
jgi:hypothetical protein